VEAPTADPVDLRARQVRRNTTSLVFAQGLAQAAAPVLLIVGSTAIADLAGDGSVGLLNGCYFVAAATGAVLIGRLMDRSGRRPGLLLAYLLIGASGVAAWVAISAGSMLGLLVAAVGFGLGFGGANLARAAVADMHAPEHRGRAVGVLLAAGVVGAVGSPFLVAYLRGVAEGRGGDPDLLPWAIVPLVAIAAFACALRLRPDPRDLAVRPEEATPTAPARSPRQLLAIPAFRVAAGAAAVGQVAMVAVMGVTPVALDHSHHASDTAVSSVISLHIAGMFAFSPLIGAALDRFGRRPGLLAGGATSIAGALVVATDANPFVVGVGLFAIGLGWSATFLGSTAVISDLTAPHERGGALGFNDLLVATASATAGFVGGFAFAGVGFRALALGVAALVFLLVLAIARVRVPASVPADEG
jgi:MFS family permease